MDDIGADLTRATVAPVAGDRTAAPGSSTSPATLFRNATYGLAARAFGVVAMALAAVITVRSLSVSEYGQLTAAMALVSMVAWLTDAGVGTLAIRQIAERPDQIERRLSVALAAELAVSVVAALLVVPLGLLLGYSPTLLAILGVGTTIVLAYAVLSAFSAAIQARRVFVYVAWYTAAQYAVLLVGIALAALIEPDPLLFAVAIATSHVAAAAAAVVIVRRRLGVRVALAGAWGGVPSVLRAAVPIAVVGSAAVVYGRIDVVLLSKLADDDDVAIYGLPLVMVELTQIVPAVVAVAFFPLLTAQLQDDAAEARASFDLVARLFLFVSVPIALVLAVGGGDIIRAVFGDAYDDSGPVLTILSGTVVLAFLNYLLWYGLLATHRERGRAPAMVAGLALNVGLNAWLIPLHGARGAAVALVISDAFMIGWLLVVVTRSAFPFRWLNLLGRPLLAGGAAAILLLLPLPDLAVACAMALAYVTVLLATRYISTVEWQPVTGPVHDVAGRLVRAVARRA
jgi:O-antigen/teichoic acid export membrane protein